MSDIRIWYCETDCETVHQLDCTDRERDREKYSEGRGCQMQSIVVRYGSVRGSVDRLQGQGEIGDMAPWNDRSARRFGGDLIRGRRIPARE